MNRFWSETDQILMKAALSEAEKARGLTAPNPMVGSVVADGGRIVGRGYHRGPGQPHAEVEALRSAGGRARGATLYVTLEPCCHHGRTPPCTEAVLENGVRRVVVATRDPNPRVNGRGLSILKSGGLQVEVGLMEAEALRLNEHYFRHITSGLPFVTYKYAMTLDGKTGCRSGDSRWISGDQSRGEVHALRRRVGAVMVGLGTALADDPQLTCRAGEGLHQPWRVVVDTEAALPPGARLIRSSSRAPAVVAAGEGAPEDRVSRLREAGAAVWTLPRREGLVDPRELMMRLGREGINGVLLEGGGTLAHSMLEADLVDKIICYIAPRLVGGEGAPTPLGGAGRPTINSGWTLKSVKTAGSGDDIRIEGYLRQGGAEHVHRAGGGGRDDSEQ